ncbi:MAG: hypothetical protein V7637_2218 [Mycobacteriales bacterium]
MSERPAATAFGPTSYLRDLVDFARRHVQVAGGSGELDAAALAARFRQPYDGLIDPAGRAAATAPVDQRQVAAEVLRRYADAGTDASRDELITLIGARQSPPEFPAATAWRLSRELRVDLSAAAPEPTTRADQAARTLQEALIALRWGHLPGGGPSWSIRDEAAFDAGWDWLGSYQTWQTATISFAYPENHLDPALFQPTGGLRPTAAYQRFVTDLRSARATGMAAWRARDLADRYWTEVVGMLPRRLVDIVTAVRSRTERAAAEPVDLPPHLDADPAAQVLHELFWLVPVALGLALADAGEHAAALGWYQHSYAYQRPPGQRQILPETTGPHGQSGWTAGEAGGVGTEAGPTAGREADADADWTAGRKADAGTGWTAGREATAGADRTAGREAGTGTGTDAGWTAGREAGTDAYWTAGREADAGTGWTAGREADAGAGWERPDGWSAAGANPHEVARLRPGARTRFTVMAIVRSLLALADGPRASDPACTVQARGLYAAAVDLMESPDATPPAGMPFPANPAALTLHARARAGLDSLDRRLSRATNRPDPAGRPATGAAVSRTAPATRGRPRRPPNVQPTGSPPRR